MKDLILTFDDGPSEKFPELLDILIKNNQKALFFCCGKNLENKLFEKDLIRAIKQGFIIGNHSYSHPNFSLVSYKKGKEEIINTDNLITELYEKAGVKQEVKLFRFPFFNEGGINFFRYQRFLKSLGYSDVYFRKKFFHFKKCKDSFYHFIQGLYRGRFDVYCDIDPRDWDTKINFDSIKNLLDKSEDKDIIDLHDQAHNLKLDKQIVSYLIKK